MDVICSLTSFMHQYFIYEARFWGKHLDSENVNHFIIMNSFYCGIIYVFKMCGNMFLHVSFTFVWHWPCFNDFLLFFDLCPPFFFIVTSCPTHMCVIVIWPGWVSGWRRPGWSVATLAVRSQPSWRRSPSKMWPPQTSHVTVSLSFTLHLVWLNVCICSVLFDTNIIWNSATTQNIAKEDYH